MDHNTTFVIEYFKTYKLVKKIAIKIDNSLLIRRVLQ